MATQVVSWKAVNNQMFATENDANACDAEVKAAVEAILTEHFSAYIAEGDRSAVSQLVMDHFEELREAFTLYR
jgi:hypothetical protein